MVTAVSIAAEVLGAAPPSCMTSVEPPVPPGISTAVPQSRSVGMFGIVLPAVRRSPGPGGLRNQVSSGNGPATIVRPDGMANMCG